MLFLLFVFKFFDFPPLAFGGATDTSIALFKCILASHLDALVFLLGGMVDHEALYEGCTYAVGGKGENFDFFVELVNAETVAFADFYVVGWFELAVTHVHASVLAGIGCE